MIIKTDKQLSERFEVAFNQIHNWLQRTVGNGTFDKYTELLRIGYSKHSVIRNYYHDLKMYGRLRNSLVHEKLEIGHYIAEPHEEVVERIETIARIVYNPKSAISIGSTPVYYYDENESIKSVLAIIQRYSYSKFPIYNKHGYIGLLTSDCLIHMLANQLNGNNISLKDFLIKDLFPLINTYTVEFAKKDLDMFEVEEIFESYHLKNKKLEAVIITENGISTEKPLGIVTSWDLVEIDAIE